MKHPKRNFLHCEDPKDFAGSLNFHLNRHGDSVLGLWRAIIRPGESFACKTLYAWSVDKAVPTASRSLEMLERIERRYRLPPGHFRAKLPETGKAPTHREVPEISRSELTRIGWHLPHDFDRRPADERSEILQWVRTVVVAGSTEYRRFHALAVKSHFALRFPKVDDMINSASLVKPKIGGNTPCATQELISELSDLLVFKTRAFTAIGENRSAVWNRETASQRLKHIALMFGALSAPSDSAVSGLGMPQSSLTMALLVFPAVWDWYLEWRETRRGFYTIWEVNMLRLVLELTHRGTGWLWQNEHLAAGLRPYAPIVGIDDITAVKSDWKTACDLVHIHAMKRKNEISRIMRVHRDSFEPIEVILDNDSPVGEYRRITKEILHRLPDSHRYPRAAAETVRGFLMLRLGLHLGVRQKNLRQLLICGRGEKPRSERQLEALKRGEMRWSKRHDGWEVVIPAAAFKNANSSFFEKRPFHILLPNLDHLYEQIDAYLRHHRGVLLGAATDPGTFFVKSVTRPRAEASFDQVNFLDAWRLMIQRYGIYNPYTGKGAVKGLLPHGPHSVRDVLATHVLKQTGSYRQAAYAIQDTPETIATHYGRFLPHDKSAQVAKILNSVWAE